MQFYLVLALAAVWPSQAAQLREVDVVNNPAVKKVVKLVTELKFGIIEDGKKEQKSYDKYACWCEDTLARKASDISEAKEAIPKMGQLIVKLGADIASHAAEIRQLKKDIAANLEAQKDATDVRDKEYGEYSDEVTQSEQCIGALEAATKALTGAGTGKKGLFLSTLEQANFVSVAANVKKVMATDIAANLLSEADARTLRAFLEHPQEKPVSAAQVGNNPAGDYAPQSTQIQGILKGMYDAFTMSLEKAHGEEADKQKIFEEIIATKKLEENTLKTTLATQEKDKADKSKTLAETRSELDNTKAQLEADEAFFADTKTTCKTKAAEWSERSRMRTEELTGIGQAIDILTSPDAQQIFKEGSETMLMQLHSVHKNSNKQGLMQKAMIKSAYGKLQDLASKFENLGMAQIAATMATGGHFEKVVAMIDDMVKLLRKEEQEDIAHKDRCENANQKNGNDKADLEAEEKKLGEEIKELNGNGDDLEKKIKALKGEIADTEEDMKERLELRNKESTEFTEALKADADAVSIINQAIKAMSQFYKNNKLKMGLVQKGKAPEYTIDPDKAPETSFSAPDKRKSESGGIVAIMSMIVEDIELEMKTGREDDAEAQDEYETDRKAMEKMLDTQVNSKIEFEKELSGTNGKIVGKEADLDETIQELKAQDGLAATLKKDCDWLKTHFDKRRKSRKTEIEGLQEAKSILSKVDAGDYNELELNSF